MPSPTTDLVRSYLKEIGRYPLLTPSQEISLAREVQLMSGVELERVSLAQKLNRQPTARELAATLGKTEAEVESILHQGNEQSKNGHQLSLTQIGERLNLSRERIRQLEHKALSILRRQKSDILEYLN